MSSQWNSDGYYYPTQIAQYGLSHYSKYIANRRRFESETPNSSSLSGRVSAAGNDAQSPVISGGWRRSATVTTKIVLDASTQRTVHHFHTPGQLDDARKSFKIRY